MASLLSTSLNVTAHLAPSLVGRRAFALFVRPLGRPRLRPGEADLMARAETRQLVVRGTRVTTYRWGDGDRPVLIVHGWSSRASRFAGLVAALLEQGRTVIAFDTPGHGESAGRDSTILDYRAVIGRLHAEHGDFSAVVAHSFGVLATFFTLRDGGIRADRVVALGGVADFDYFLNQFCTRLRLGRRIRWALRDHIEHRIFTGEPDIWRRLDASRRSPDITAPILLVHDTDDGVAAPAQAREIAAARLPGSPARDRGPGPPPDPVRPPGHRDDDRLPHGAPVRRPRGRRPRVQRPSRGFRHGARSARGRHAGGHPMTTTGPASSEDVPQSRPSSPRPSFRSPGPVAPPAPAPGAGSTDGGGAKARRVLLSACPATFLAFLDATVVNVAFPRSAPRSWPPPGGSPTSWAAAPSSSAPPSPSRSPPSPRAPPPPPSC
ncbi:alpha/beta fold hydrolase [Streptomyces sp. NPDC058701]|uniref:alpha/beta fold hydrolase n=1 Tax=Streptomyces sp. NPDC058701 TaxID=3346608 RepID=UPI003649EFC1